MRLGWNEIRARAAKFAATWKGEGYEKGDTHTFYNEFFALFDIRARSVGRFEKHVQKLDNSKGFIDLFWPGVLLVEQKSAGRDLKKALVQAESYFDALKEVDKPRYILISDFQSFDLYDLDEKESTSFALKDLPKNIDKFSFILGIQKRSFKDQDPVNIDAAALVGTLHDALEDSGYVGHDLERFLVRLVFCLFADDTGVFEPRGIFLDFLEARTSADGADLGGWLAKLFEVLDTPENNRSKHLDEDLARFPYVNGDLFKETTRIPDFNSKMRSALLDASNFDWSPISPAIFGSLFQSVMNRQERRESGAHYTTEKNILKVIGPLFLDGLRAELNRIKPLRTNRQGRFQDFQTHLSKLYFLDPACGCGNFLVIAYREIRLIETEVIEFLYKDDNQMNLDVSTLSMVDVDQFAGIEISEFPARIAETAMWMMDHIMNSRLALSLGKNYARIPLKKSPVIRNADALDVDWKTVLPPKQCSFVLGNPPFIGHQWRSAAQKAGMHRVWGREGQLNRLDFVTCWFRLAVDYAAKNPKIKIAFVATNSITQGEQAAVLWPRLFALNAHITFAHRTFAWGSEARGKAAVHCVIVGMSLEPAPNPIIFDYDDIKGEPHEASVNQINGYLIDSPRISIPARSKAPAGIQPMFKGSQPTDGARLRDARGNYVTTSNLIMDEADAAQLTVDAPIAAKWLRPFVGGDELISGIWRQCLWLKDANPSELKGVKPIKLRLDRVRAGRLQSSTASVREFANSPTLFTQDRQPNCDYIAVPRVSSEKREYIPIAILPKNVIAHEKLLIIPSGELWLFALLNSSMHMGWMRAISGRLESRYSYAPTVYNSFPRPEISNADKVQLTNQGQTILDERNKYPDSQLSDLYDPDAMPDTLRKAHEDNNKLVDGLYRKGGFKSERERTEHLFSLFEKRSSPLENAAKAGKKKKGIVSRRRVSVMLHER